MLREWPSEGCHSPSGHRAPYGEMRASLRCWVGCRPPRAAPWGRWTRSGGSWRTRCWTATTRTCCCVGALHPRVPLQVRLRVRHAARAELRGEGRRQPLPVLEPPPCSRGPRGAVALRLAVVPMSRGLGLRVINDTSLYPAFAARNWGRAWRRSTMCRRCWARGPRTSWRRSLTFKYYLPGQQSHRMFTAAETKPALINKIKGLKNCACKDRQGFPATSLPAASARTPSRRFRASTASWATRQALGRAPRSMSRSPPQGEVRTALPWVGCAATRLQPELSVAAVHLLGTACWADQGAPCQGCGLPHGGGVTLTAATVAPWCYSSTADLRSGGLLGMPRLYCSEATAQD